MQFGCTLGRSTTDVIPLIRQQQEKYLAKDNLLCLAFVDLEKALLVVNAETRDKWLVRAVQAMNKNAVSKVRVDNKYSKEFRVQVGTHQGSVLRPPLLLIIVLQAMTRIQGRLSLGAPLCC